MDRYPKTISRCSRLTPRPKTSRRRTFPQVCFRPIRADAQHIAIATVARVDVLLSWNFRHIVNLQRIHGYNSVNLRQGFPMIEIRTPREVLSDEQED